MNTVLIILLLLIIGGGIVCYLVYLIKNTAETVTFGLNLLKTGLEQQENEIEVTPKSVNGMTSLCIPRITKDFPEFNYDWCVQKTEILLKSCFLAIY